MKSKSQLKSIDIVFYQLYIIDWWYKQTMFHRVYVLMANKTEEFYNFILKLRCNYLINNDLEDLLEKLSELIYKYNDENVDSCEMHQQRHQLYRYTLLL